MLAVIPMMLAFISPHAALPSAIALFLASRRSRLPLVIGVVALAIVSVFVLGFTGNVVYFTEVLPIHANAEVLFNGELSLTHMRATMHIAADNALREGTLSYAFLSRTAIYFAVRNRANGLPHSLANAILFPAAIAALGGTCVHAQEVALAILAAMMLASESNNNPRRVFASIACFGLLFGGDNSDDGIAAYAYVAACISIALLIWCKRKSQIAPIVTTTLAVALVLISTVHLLRQSPHRFPQPSTRDVAITGIEDERSPSTRLERFIKQAPSYSTEDPWTESIKLPMWIGLVAVFFLGLSSSDKTSQVIPESRTSQAATGMQPRSERSHVSKDTTV